MINWEKILENKYNYLLTMEILIVIAYPIFHFVDDMFPLSQLLILLALAPALNVALSFRKFLLVMSMGLIVFILRLVTKYQAEALNEEATFVVLAFYSVFLVLSILILLKKIASYRIVTSDTIKGGISIYILVGFLWTMFYLMLLLIDPQAIKNLTEGKEILDCYYYSFTTLTTLGYGDIAPVTSYAKILAVTEAVVGP
ncbi:MAG: ion channel, partial [Planctomycetota bacterium]